MREGWPILRFVCLGILVLVGSVAHSQSTGTIVAWGRNQGGQCDVPVPNENFVAVAAGCNHSLGLRSDGTIIAWGYNQGGQCDVPAPNESFIAVAAGCNHSLGLKSDGTIVAWGYNKGGQCDVPAPNAGFVDIIARWWHNLGLKSDGTVVAWGANIWGQCDVPAPNAEFVQVAAGCDHSLGLKSYRTIVAWGANAWGQCNVPVPNADFVAVAAGCDHSLGLKSDGAIVVWGSNFFGQCNVPLPNADFVAIAAGDHHCLGLKSDGTIVAWGYNQGGQCDVPAPNESFVAVTAGCYHNLGVKVPLIPTLLQSYSAYLQESGITIEWTLSIAGEDVRFYVFRAEAANSVFKELFTSRIERKGLSFSFIDESCEFGTKYCYRVMAEDEEGRTILFETDPVSIPPLILTLHQNYPNPFNPVTTISFTLPEKLRVDLSIYNIEGKVVKILVDERLDEGYKDIDWDGTDSNGKPVTSGVYFCRLKAGEKVLTKKMILLK